MPVFQKRILSFIRRRMISLPRQLAKRSASVSRHYGATLASTAFIFSSLTVTMAVMADESQISTPPDEFIKSLINRYCGDQNYRFSYLLSKSVYEQLSWLMHNEISSPELRAKLSGDNLNMEIKRALSRLYCFDLLLRDDMPVDEAYRQFIISQEDNALTLAHFEQLREQARGLTADEREAIKASCILTKSQCGDNILKSQGMMEAPADSEEFLTWLSYNADAMNCFPVCAALSESQKRLLQRLYIPLHGRAIPFTEGAFPMVRYTLGLTAVWKMRWWVNLMGFRGHEGAGAKYLNEKRFEFFQDCYQLIEENRHHPIFILRSWLKKVAGVSRLKEYALTPSEEIVVAHILSFYGEYLPQAQIAQVMSGYGRYKQAYPEACENLVRNYNTFLASLANTPTYTPAVLHTAETLLNNATSMVSSESPRSVSVEYTLQLLQQLHQYQPLMESSIVSCRDEAWYSSMAPKIGMWQQSGREHLQCAVVQKNGEQVLSCQSPSSMT